MGVYTVGNGRVYRAIIALDGAGYKKGRTEDYTGGCVFNNLDDAYRFIEIYMGGDTDFVPFGLRAEWGVDTEPSEDGWWHYLLETKEFFPIPEISYTDRLHRQPNPSINPVFQAS